MEEINIKDIAPYNEVDFACNGGFFNCPHCSEQNYVRESINGMETECCECYKLIRFV